MLQNPSLRNAHWKWTILFSLMFLYILGRLLAIFTPEISYWSLMVDEMPTGNISHDLDRGLVLHYPFYQFKPFAAGTLIEGLVAHPFMKAFGRSLFSLKCSAIVFGLGTLALWYLLLWRYVGALAAIFTGSLLTFAPMGYINLTTTAWGNHTESSFFTIAILFALFWAYYDRNPARRPPFFPVFLAGLIAGFGVYFTYTGAVTLIFGMAIILLIGGKIQWKGPIWYYTAGAIAGFLPILPSVRAYGLPALGRIDTYSGYSSGSLITISNLFMETDWKMMVAKFFYSLTRDIPKSFCCRYFAEVKGPFWSFCLYLLILIMLLTYIFLSRKKLSSLFGRIFSGKKTRENVSVLLVFSLPFYVLLFLVIFSISGFRVLNTLDPDPGSYAEFRYLAPLVPFLFAIAGLGIQSLWNFFKTSKILKAAMLVVCSIIVAFWGATILSMGGNNHHFRALQIRGDFYSLIVERVAMEISKHEKQLTGKMDWIERLPKNMRPLFFEKLGSINHSAFTLSNLLAMRLDAAMVVHCYRGFGKLSGMTGVNENNGDPVKTIRKILEENTAITGKNRVAFLEGVGEGLFFALQPYLGAQWCQARLVKLQAFWDTISDLKDSQAVQMGVGRGIGSTFSLEDLEDATPEPAFWIGVGRQLKRNAKIQLLRNDLALDTINYLPQAAFPWIYIGWALEGTEFFLEGI